MSEKIELLYEKFRKPLLRFIRHKVTDAHLAEDLLHEVFIKASRSLESLSDGTKIQSWLFTIASNTVKDHFRKHKIALTDEPDISGGEPLADSVMNELECCLNAFISKLPKAQSDSLKSIYFEEASLREYAETNNINLSTVKSHVKRGKEALKTLLEGCCSFEHNVRGELVDFRRRC